MPRRTRSVPSLRRHKASGQAVVTLNGRDFYLGSWPLREDGKPLPATQVVREAYDRMIPEWLANGRQLVGDGRSSFMVYELLLA